MPFIDAETHQFISPREMAQRELRAAEQHLSTIEANLHDRLLTDDPAVVAAELADARRRVVHAREAVKDMETAAEQKAAAARDREERARLRNLRARSGEYSSATRDLRKALGEVERHYGRATDTIGAISAALPNDVCLPPGYWTWTELEIVENAAAVEAVVREQITVAAAALRASGHTPFSEAELVCRAEPDIEDTNTEEDTVPASSECLHASDEALSESAGTVANNDVIGDTSTSSTEE